MVTPIIIRHRSNRTEGCPCPSFVDGGANVGLVDSDGNEVMDVGDVGDVGEDGGDVVTKSGVKEHERGLPPAPRLLGENSIFITQRPEGGMRDVLNVECSKINGEDFKGTITYNEATIKIFQQKMDLPVENLHSIKMSFNQCQMVSFKLKNQINIDEMANRECFTLERSYMQGSEFQTDVIACKITGIRKPRTTT